MGNTVPEKESIEHCSYTVMFTILSGFMGISSPPKDRPMRVYLLAESADRDRDLIAYASRSGPRCGTGWPRSNAWGRCFRWLPGRYATRHFQDAVVGTLRKTQAINKMLWPLAQETSSARLPACWP